MKPSSVDAPLSSLKTVNASIDASMSKSKPSDNKLNTNAPIHTNPSTLSLINMRPASPNPFEEDSYENLMDIKEVAKRSNGNNNMSCKLTYLSKCSHGREMYSYVRFWRRLFHPEDCYRSPLFQKTNDDGSFARKKYLVFMPDGGGWNNIRLGWNYHLEFENK